MSNTVHHPYAAARYLSTIYHHASPFDFSSPPVPCHVHSGQPMIMDSSDSEMASDDHASVGGGAMCLEIEDIDIDMAHRQSLAEDSDAIAIEIEADAHNLDTKYWNLFDKYGQLQGQLREKEQELCRKEVELRALKGKMNSNPFACVLVDGDGAVFNEQFIARGEEGGKEAGDMLYHGLKKRLQADQELCDLGITNIMVQVYLNVEGMGRALHNAGLLGTGLPADAVRQLTQFGRGFNRAQMLFSFIDVGREKEAADHKIRSLFELMEKILNCKCLILAGCHDNGYGRLLDTYEYKYRSEAPWHKIRLLVTTPTPEKSAYRTSQYRDAFPTMTLPEVFRSDPVVALGQAGYNNGSLSAPRTALNRPWWPSEHVSAGQDSNNGGSYKLSAFEQAGEAAADRELDLVSSFLSSIEDTLAGGASFNNINDDNIENTGRPSPLSSYAGLLQRSEPFHPTPCSSSPSSLALVPTPSPLPSTSKSAFYSKPNAIIPSRSLLPPSAPTHDKAPLRTGTQHQAPLTFKQVAFSQGGPFQHLLPGNAVPTTTISRVSPSTSNNPGFHYTNTERDQFPHVDREQYTRPSLYCSSPFINTGAQDRSLSHHGPPPTTSNVPWYTYERAYYLNAMKQRIDPPLSCPTELSNRLKALGEILRPGGSPKEQRFCNKWHISGFCPDMAPAPIATGVAHAERARGHAARHGCPYIHGERLTGDLLTAVRYNARNLKCKDSMKCRDVDCHMGHHCFKPWECSYSGCKFGDCHGVVFSLDPVCKVDGKGIETPVSSFTSY